MTETGRTALDDRSAVNRVAPLGPQQILVVAGHRPTRHLIERALRAGDPSGLQIRHVPDVDTALASLRVTRSGAVIVAEGPDAIAGIARRYPDIAMVEVCTDHRHDTLRPGTTLTHEHVVLSGMEPTTLHRALQRAAQRQVSDRDASPGRHTRHVEGSGSDDTGDEVPFHARLLAAVGEAVAATDVDGRIIYLNPAAERLYGWPLHEALGQNSGAISISERSGDGAVMVARQIRNGQPWSGDLWLRRRDGSEFFGHVTNTPILDRAGSSAGMIGVTTDLTEQQRTEQLIDHELRHDSLTGLPNRAEITRRLDELLDAHRNGGPPVTIGFLDLDRFKVINDGLGHATGDRVLVEVGRRLRVAIGSNGTVGRFGGDEFVVLCTGHDDPDVAVEEVRRIVASLTTPIEIDHRRFFVTASVGVAISDPDDDSTDILQATDTAMYESKKSTGQRVTYFDAPLRARARRHHRIEHDLRQAIEQGDLEVHYQPIIRLGGERCVGFESLARWNHPRLGNIAPDDFIPIAEETGLIVPLGESVLRTSLDQLRRWQRLPGHESLSMAVNLSCNQLNRADITRSVESALADAQVHPSSLHLEITESVLMDRIEGSLDTLRSLRSLGVQLSVDDFGTGYSSLSYLKRLPVQTLKIDRTFTDGLGTDPDDTSIVRAISALADELGLELLAEGVETAAQVSELAELGCRLAQGYWWSRPLDAASATRWLCSRAPRER